MRLFQILFQACSDIFEYYSREYSCIIRTFRSSHQRCSIIKVVLRNFAKFTGKHLCQCLFFNKVVGLRTTTLLKKRLWHRCFPVNFAKFLRTPFLQNTPGRLLLYYEEIKWCTTAEPYQTFMMEFFCEKSFLLVPSSVFAKALHHRCLAGSRTQLR